MLTVREHMALRLAATPYRRPAQREEDAIINLGMTPTRFHQVVAGLLDRQAALEAMPTDVHRLRRLRDARRDARSRRAR